jgi:hypothetical protein
MAKKQQRHSSPALAKLASKVLKSDNYSKVAKTLAASVLSQNAPKPQKKKK